MDEDRVKKRIRPTDYLALERTFLAWIRTAISIIAFGLILEKFNVLIKVMDIGHSLPDLSRHMGTFIIAIGLIVLVLAITHFFTGVKKLRKNAYHSNITLYITITFFVAVLALLTVLYVFLLKL
jgi:putative membrane protein